MFQASCGRIGRQQQEQTSWHDVQALFPGPVVLHTMIFQSAVLLLMVPMTLVSGLPATTESKETSLMNRQSAVSEGVGSSCRAN